MAYAQQHDITIVKIVERNLLRGRGIVVTAPYLGGACELERTVRRERCDVGVNVSDELGLN